MWNLCAGVTKVNVKSYFSNSVMSYRTTEVYAMAVPIFAPSPKFYMNYEDHDLSTLGLGSDRTR